MKLRLSMSIIGASLIFLGGGVANAQISQSTGSGSLQGQSDAIQNTNSGVQSGSSLQRDGASLDAFSQSSSAIPLGSNSSAAKVAPAPAKTSSFSLARIALFACLAIGSLLAGLIAWGVMDSTKKPEPNPIQPPEIPKKKKPKTGKKKKKAHR